MTGDVPEGSVAGGCASVVGQPVHVVDGGRVGVPPRGLTQHLPDQTNCKEKKINIPMFFYCVSRK